MNCVIVIPARLASSRFPEKLLQPLAGKSVLQRTWEQAQQVQGAQRVVVAADSQRVAEHVASFGGEAFLTDPALASGTLRIHAVLDQLEADFVLNVQADEPLISPHLLDRLVEAAKTTHCDIVTAVTPIDELDDVFDSNVVKAVLAPDGRVLYFSRNPAPFVRDRERLDWMKETTFYRHIGTYGYTPEALRWYASQQPTNLEEVEKLEQLRFSAASWKFQTVVTEEFSSGIDIPQDLVRAHEILEEANQQTSKTVSPHYLTAREVIYREVDALEELLERNREGISTVVELLLQATGKIVVAGLGKSGLVGQKMASTFTSTGSPAVFLSAAEALHGDLGVVEKGDVVLMISNSASTAELSSMMPSLRQLGVQVAGLFGKTSTSLANSVDAVLDIGADREACPLNLAPMTTTTNTLVMGDALAAALMKSRGFTPEEFATYHPGGALGRKLLFSVDDVIAHDAEVPTVSPESSLRDVVIAISQGVFGAVCVVEKNGEPNQPSHEKAVGIITDGDIRRHLLESDDLSVRAKAIMTSNPIVAAPELPLGQCLELMESKRVYVLPVVSSEGTLRGMIRMHDIVS
ncbi:MAG: 3-deoxy-manno-octulosonate cytidylyltransferase [Verrucomicrobiota bacterium]